MPRAAPRSVATLAREASATAGVERRVDLAISLRLAEYDGVGEACVVRPGSDQELLRVGGKWDRRRREWCAEADEELVLRAVPSQNEFFRWLTTWGRCIITGDWTGAVRVFVAILIGARRSGKTHGALVALVVYAVAVPRSILWALSPTLENNDEIDRTLREMLPAKWYKRREIGTGKAVQYRFANGSRILLRSAHKPRTLRAGRVDVVLMNEAQNQANAAFVNLHGAIVDRGGCVLLAANPPDTIAGEWLEELWLKVRAGEAAGVGFQFDARKNPRILFEALEAMSAVVDAKTAARDIEGLMGVPVGDRVFYAWSDVESWRDPWPDLVDITHDFTRKVLGKSYGYIAGADFQHYPAMVCAIAKVFEEPGHPGEPILFFVDEMIVPESDEYELIDELEALDRWTPTGRIAGDGYRGWFAEGDVPSAAVHVGVVGDASGFFQSGSHAKGERSDRMFASRRWTMYKPQRDSDKNPSILERCRLVNSLLHAHDGRRRLFVARHCKATAESLRKWENRLGTPYRRSDFAHLSDAVCYAAWRAFGEAPRAKGATTVTYNPIGRFRRAELYATGTPSPWRSR